MQGRSAAAGSPPALLVALVVVAALASPATRARAQAPEATEAAPTEQIPPDEQVPTPEEEPEPAPGTRRAPERVAPEPMLRAPTDATYEDDDEDPSIAALEEQMVPTLTLPEFRVRAGGGIGIQTSGESNVYARITQEAEWQPPSLEFVSFGIGAAESIGAQSLYQVGGRIGGYAWFCEDPVVRCQGAITLQLGAVFGAVGPDFDFSADVDLRFLFVKTVELHLRGGFFAVQMISFVNVTGGLAIAF